MAHLTHQEFTKVVTILAEDIGLQRLRDRLVRLNALVTRRRAVSAERLAEQLYQLTAGLRRQVPATAALQALWAEQLNAKIDEDSEKAFEEVASKINACLGERDAILEGKEAELDQHLREYEQNLTKLAGPDRARLDMLVKALPRVADRLRSLPPPPPSPAPEEGETPAATAPAPTESET